MSESGRSQHGVEFEQTRNKNNLGKQVSQYETLMNVNVDAPSLPDVFWCGLVSQCVILKQNGGELLSLDSGPKSTCSSWVHIT